MQKGGVSLITMNVKTFNLIPKSNDIKDNNTFFVSLANLTYFQSLQDKMDHFPEITLSMTIAKDQTGTNTDLTSHL